MKMPVNGNESRGGRLLTRVLLILGGLAALGAILWVVLLPAAVVSTIHSRTGFVASVEKVSVNPFTGHAQIKGLTLRNPEGWPAEEFIELREFRAEASPFSLLSPRFEASEVLVDLGQVKLIRNQQGKLNATAFHDGFKGRSAGGTGPNQQNAHKQGFLIKHLVLKFDKLVVADYSDQRPVIKEYSLNLNEDLRNVDNVAQLMSPLTGSALTLVNEAAGGVLKNHPELLRGVAAVEQEAGKKTGEKFKGLLDSLDKKRP